MATRLGRISSVFIDEDRNKVTVNVITGPGVEHRDLPFVSLKPSFWLVPQEGDIVEVYEVDREMVARFPHNTSMQAIPDLGEGDVCLKLDDETELRFQKSGDAYDVTLSASGDIEIDTTGEVFINGIGFESHTHDYSWTDSGGSGTTGTPE